MFGTKANVKPPYLTDSAEMTDETTNETSNDEVEVDSVDIINDIAISNRSTTMKPNDLPEEIQKPQRMASKRKVQDTGLQLVARSVEMRTAVQQSELELNKEKWEEEKRVRGLQYELEREKFLHQKWLDEKRMELEEQKIKNEVEVEKFKIQEEYKLKLELAKLKSTQ